MRLLRVLVMLSLSMFFLANFVSPAYCSRQFNFQEPEFKKMTVNGTVSSVSRMDQKITITYKDAQGQNAEMALKIDNDTRVVKNDVMISSNDISGMMTGDKVAISYFEDPRVTGDFTADTITLESR